MCHVVAGPNGAGKTTFALKYLPELAKCRRFVNADAIAAGLSPLAPDDEQIRAGKLFLREIKAHIAAGKSFAFETTLAGRGHVRTLANMRKADWRIVLIYLWLPDAEFSRRRVAERVAQGGHNIPEQIIQRRFAKSLRNLFLLYMPRCNEVQIYDNSEARPELIVNCCQGHTIIANNKLYDRIRRFLSS